MGFFSRIKKLWTGENAAPETPASLDTPLQEVDAEPSSAITPDLKQPAEPLQAEPLPEEGRDLPEEAPERVSVSEHEPDLGQEEILPQEAPAEADTQPVQITEEDRSYSVDMQPEISAEPQLEASDSIEPTPQPQESPKVSGWKKFFGLAPQAEQTASAPLPKKDKPVAPHPELFVQEKPTTMSLEPWQESLITALRDAEPRLSAWMEHLLDGVSRQGEVLWDRLRFLFAQLDVPAAESEDFIKRFATWLDDMGYDHVEEFRSELQYRMALALDLEDEEDERSRLFLKLSEGLGKTREQLTMRIDQLLSLSGSYDDEFWDELEEILLMADVGLPASQELFKRLKPKLRQAKARDAQEFKTLLKEELASVFRTPAAPAVALLPEVVLMVGVNGAGKTTTIAKLAHRAQMQGRKVLVAAGDTFRAAAIEQLQVWSKRVGAGFYAKEHGSDPAAVAFEAIDHAMHHGYDMVFVDTAGRLQTKHNLMEELKKISRVMGKKLEGAPHRTILVLDATTGQNALSQVKLFSQASPIDEIVLTKLDGTAKGGIIVAIALEYDLPISFIGLGEKMEDLRPFSGQEFANALFA